MSKIKIKNMKHAVQAVILNEKGQTLCVSRKYDHNSFGLPGGKVDDTDHSLESAMSREIYEETGLSVNMETAIMVFQMHKDGYMGHTFLIKDWSGEIETDEPHVVKWGNFSILKKGTFGYWNSIVSDSLISMGVEFEK